MRLAKYLAHAGVASRRAAEDLIRAGRVSVDGEVVADLGRQVSESAEVRVDGAVVRGGQFSNLIGSTASITPGFGLRFDTYVGPVRLDLGIRPTLVEDLPVVTDVAGPGGTEQLVTLKTLRRYDPVQGSGGIRGILNRLMLHLAIGPAF